MPRQAHRGRSHWAYSRNRTTGNGVLYSIPIGVSPTSSGHTLSSPLASRGKEEKNVHSLPGENREETHWSLLTKDQGGWPPVLRAVCLVTLSLLKGQLQTSVCVTLTAESGQGRTLTLTNL